MDVGRESEAEEVNPPVIALRIAEPMGISVGEAVIAEMGAVVDAVMAVNPETTASAANPFVTDAVTADIASAAYPVTDAVMEDTASAAYPVTEAVELDTA
jgi:hypothetical protein